MGVHQAIKQEKVVYTQEHLKLNRINVSILNTTVIYLRFIKSTIFMLYIKQKIENNCIGFFQARKLTITDKMTSVRKSYISKSVKK